MKLIQSLGDNSALFKKESKATVYLALPIVLGQLLQMSMGVVDTIMSGNLSANDLAAVALGSNLFHPLMVFVAGISLAVTPIVAQHFGAGRTLRIGKTIRQGLWLIFLLSIPGVILIRNTHFVLELMGIDEAVRPIILGYLNAISWGLPGLFGFFILRSFNEGVSVTKPVMYVSFLGLCINIAGNYTLVFGKFGFPKLGAVGTGWTSAVVMWVMFFALFIYTYSKKDYQAYKIFKNLKLPNWLYIREILKIGVPNGLSITMEVGVFAAVSLFAGKMGAIYLGAHQIAISIASLTFMVPLGVSFATTARVGQAIGRKSYYDAKVIGYIGVAISVLVMSISALIMANFNFFLTGLYSNNTEVVSIAAQLLILAAIFQVFDGLQVAGFGALRGLKDTTIPMYVNLFSYWGIGLPLSYYLGFIAGKGVEGLWYGLILGLTIAAIFHNYRFWKLIGKVLANVAVISGANQKQPLLP